VRGGLQGRERLFQAADDSEHEDFGADVHIGSAAVDLPQPLRPHDRGGEGRSSGAALHAGRGSRRGTVRVGDDGLQGTRGRKPARCLLQKAAHAG